MSTACAGVSEAVAKKTPSPRRSVLFMRIPWIPFVSLIAMINLSFLTGAVVMLTNGSPAGFLRRGYRGACAWYERFWPEPKTKAQEDFFEPASTEQRPAVVLDEPANACDGFTLVTTARSSGAQLLNMRGQVVHEWSMPFRTAWPTAPHITWPVSDDQIHWFRACLYPNGDVLAVYHAENDTPYGYGLAKLDKSSRLLWTYSAYAHHDVDVGEDGIIYLLTQDIVETQPKDASKSPHPSSCLADALVVLSPEGREKSKVALADALAASPYALLPWKPDSLMLEKGDFFHANSVKVLHSDQAAKFPLFRTGQVLISIRNQDLLIVVDPQQGTVVWASRGPWHHQHDAEFLGNGRLLVFDNMGASWNYSSLSPVDKQSRVLEFDPVTQAVPWVYTGNAQSPFFSRMRGTKQRLANGNTFIVDPEHGAVFEVTPLQRIVWKYLGSCCCSDGAHIVPITGARRYSEAELPFMRGIAHARP